MSAITGKLSLARGFDRAVALASGAFLVIAATWLAVLLLFFIDYRVQHLPAWGRVFGWLGLFAVAGLVGWRHVLRPQIHTETDDCVALRFESVCGSLGGRLIATVQLSREMDRWRARGVGRLVELLRAQTERLFAELSPARITSVRSLGKSIALAAVVIGAWSWAYAAHGGLWSIFAQRMQFVGREYPSRTKIADVLPGDETNPVNVLHGSPLEFRVRFEPEHAPDEATLELTDRHGRTVEVEMVEQAKHAFTARLRRVAESFRYRVLGGDARRAADSSGRPYRVAVQRRPALDVEVDLLAPLYTVPQKGEAAARSLRRTVPARSAAAIQGTVPTVRATCSKDIVDIRIVVLAGQKGLEGRSLPMDVRTKRTAELELPRLEKTLRYTIQVTDTQGIRNFELLDDSANPPPIFVLRATPDRRPRVTITEPAEDSIEVREASQTNVAALATDDYGVVRVDLFWRRGAYGSEVDANAEAWQVRTLWPPARAGRVLRERRVPLGFQLAPAELGARPGDTITFFVEAVDNVALAAGSWGPEDKNPPRGVGRSKQYTIVVIDAKTFSLRLKQRLEGVGESLIRIHEDWDKVHREIQTPAPEDKKPKPE
jgi:hypothetical protein